MTPPRTAVVTGAASGIGAVTSQLLRDQGWRVLGLDLQAGTSSGIDTDTDTDIVATDITDEVALAAAALHLGDGGLDALVCSAGVWLPGDDRYASVDLDVWARTLAVNVTGTMLTLRTFAPHLRAGGSVVTIGSIAALTGIPKRDAYTASKGAVVALTRAWAADLIRLGIRVNCVAPGQVATPMTAHVTGLDHSRLPLGREADPLEVARVIAALCDPGLGYLNGAIIPVDGGLTAASGLVPLSPRVFGFGA